MNEIQTETIDAQAESVLFFDLFNNEDQEESAEFAFEETPAETDAEEQTEIPASLPRPSVLESAPELAPFQLDQEALFRELIAQHQRRLYRFVIKYIDHPDDAADITQQAFAEAARTIATFRGDSKLSTWLFGIAMNMVRNYLRKMIEQASYELPALSYQELPPEVNIHPHASAEL